MEHGGGESTRTARRAPARRRARFGWGAVGRRGAVDLVHQRAHDVSAYGRRLAAVDERRALSRALVASSSVTLGASRGLTQKYPSVGPVWRSWAKTSEKPGVSPGTRLPATDVNTTKATKHPAPRPGVL